MAKAKTARRTVKKNAARQASKKKTPAKKAVRKTARPKVVKPKPARKATKKPAAKRSRSATMVKPPRKNTSAGTSAGKAATAKVIAPIAQKPATTSHSIPVPERHPPAAPVAPRPAPPPPAPAPPPRTFDVAPVREPIAPRGFIQGQRVRHRYEHWWGTVVQKLDDLGSPEGTPAPDRYIVTVDGGQIRDDIRPEDLTAT